MHGQNQIVSASLDARAVASGSVASKLDEDELASSRHASNGRVPDSSIECFDGKRRDQFRQTNFAGDDRSPDNDATQGAHDVLDLRQLRHFRSVKSEAVESQSTSGVSPTSF